MAGVNKAILVGFLGADPEVRYIPNGTAVATFSIATSESWRDKITGEKKEHTEWHHIVVWGRKAEIAGEYLRKGSQVYIEGSLRTRNWTPEGSDKPVYITEVPVSNGDTMNMIGGKTNSDRQPQRQKPQNQQQGGGWGGQQQSQPQQQQYSGQPQAAGTQNPPMDFDDDIPF